MYNHDEFIIVPHKVMEQEFPDILASIHEIMVNNKVTEAPELYVICFTNTAGWAELSLKARHVDVHRVAGAMSPQEWLMHLYEGTLPRYLKEATVAVYKRDVFYTRLCAWVAANAKKYLVKVTVSGLPYSGILSLTVIATDEEQARSLAYAMCSGMPVVFKEEDVSIRKQVVWW